MSSALSPQPSAHDPDGYIPEAKDMSLKQKMLLPRLSAVLTTAMTTVNSAL